MKLSVLEELVEALRCLPGVGPKSAQRMAYHLLQHDRAGAQRLGDALRNALPSGNFRSELEDTAAKYEELKSRGCE